VNNRILILITIVFVISGLTYFWYSSAEQESKADRSSEAAVDTTLISDRPSSETSHDTTPPPPAENLAPGTAMVQMKIVSVTSDNGKPSQIVGRVQEVLGYGSSTSPIAVGSEIPLNISGFLEMNPDRKSAFSPDSTVTFLLSETTGMQQVNSSNTSNTWIINRFIE